MLSAPRVVLLAFDGFPLHAVGERHTPNLMRLAQSGGWSPVGGRSGLPSTTYPGFVSLLTGCSRTVSGVRTTSRKRDAVPGWAGSDVALVPTILHEAHAAGLRTAGVFGDHKLVSVARLAEMADVWPAHGDLPSDLPLDAHGYPVNSAVLPQALEAVANPEIALTFCHFNETDTVGHDRGPEAPETIDCVREADAGVGRLIRALEPDWDRTIVMVASDHDMEPRTEDAPIDLSTLADGPICDWIADGSAALARLSVGVEHDHAIGAIRKLDGIAGWRSYDPDVLLVVAEPGRVFAGQKVYAGGTHGNRTTARTLAIVGGGHPHAASIGRAIEVTPPRIRDWAPTIAEILGLHLPASDGDSILGAARPATR